MVLVLIVAFLAATAVTRFRLRGAKAFLVLILVVQMVPTTALVIPLFLILDKARLLNSFQGLILTYVALTLPFTIWVLRGFVRGVPVDLEEAALVDGCTRVGAFRRILLPLVLPGLIATGVFSFITAWNDFLYADVIMQQQGSLDLAGLAVRLPDQHRSPTTAASWRPARFLLCRSWSSSLSCNGGWSLVSPREQ